ncbi:hypothetical protein [Pedobacter steynii]
MLGEFDGYPMWNWFSNFMGGIRFTNYIADFASANVRVEDKSHPVMKGVSPSFKVDTEELKRRIENAKAFHDKCENKPRLAVPSWLNTCI